MTATTHTVFGSPLTVENFHPYGDHVQLRAIGTRTGQQMKLVLSREAALQLSDQLADHASRRPQKFTVEIEVPDHLSNVNIHEVKNHVRKYVAEKAGGSTSEIGGAARELTDVVG